MARVNDIPVSATNPLPQIMMVKDVLTGLYSEVDSATPLQVVLNNAASVSGQTLISLDDGLGNPITISRSIVDPGAMKVEVINQSAGSSNIIELDDGLGNPVTIAHVAGVQTISVNNFPAVQNVAQVDDNRKVNFDNGAGVNVPASHINGQQKVAVEMVDAVTGIPFGMKHVHNKLRVSSSGYYDDIAKGDIAGHWSINQQADTLLVPALPTLASNLLLPVEPVLRAPAKISIVSTSALDTGSGINYTTVAPTLPAVSYPIGSTIFNIDNGVGGILVGDTITFAGDINPYIVVSYLPNIAPLTGGVLTIAPTLIATPIGAALTITPAIVSLGLHQLDLIGLDALGNHQEETVVLGGILPVLTTKIWDTVNAAYAHSAPDAVLGAAGTITLTTTLPVPTVPPTVFVPPIVPAVIHQIDIGKTKTHTLFFKMPLDRKGVITQIHVGSDQRILLVEAFATVDPISKNIQDTYVASKTIFGDRGSVTYNFDFPQTLPPGAEFKVLWSDPRGKGISANVDFEMFFEDLL